MTRELRNLARAIMLAFSLIALSSAYWGIFQQDDLRERTDNLRKVYFDQNFERGRILDRKGVVLATNSTISTTAYDQRIYPYDNVAGAIGYYSYQYGTEGLEAAFSDILTGQFGDQSFWDQRWDDLLNRERVGYDLRSTIDLTIQQAVAKSFGERNGAAVVIHVPTGEVLAMVSQPELDANVLDLNWATYNEEVSEETMVLPESPLFNRVRRGIYQPGSAIYPVILMALLNSGDTMSRIVSNGIDSVQLPPPSVADDVNLETVYCLTTPPQTFELTLLDAFAYGCPQPFVTAFAETLVPSAYQELLGTIGFLDPPPLFRMDTDAGVPPLSLDRRNDPDEQAILEAVGQGQLTLTPLQVARFVAAIANQGNAPPLHVANAYRLPETTEWISLEIPRRQPALLRTDIAEQLQSALRYTAQRSPLVQHAVVNSGATLYGYVGTSQAGTPVATYSWFLGFIKFADGSSIVVVVVVEDAQEIEEAAIIAQTAFEVSLNVFEPQPVN
jgi:peptidoglycan glycosyltransferase